MSKVAAIAAKMTLSFFFMNPNLHVPRAGFGPV
jgi:hypothetical protein